MIVASVAVSPWDWLIFNSYNCRNFGFDAVLGDVGRVRYSYKALAKVGWTE